MFSLKQFALSILILLSIPCLAQESILTASGNATGSGGEASYSVGQVAFKTVESAGGTITEGVQQPYEILFMTGIEDDRSISLDCFVYPNPATSAVKLRIDRPSPEKYSYHLKNSNGQIVSEMQIETRETVIPLSGLPAGTYILTLLDDNKNVTTWKVIKY